MAVDRGIAHELIKSAMGIGAMRMAAIPISLACSVILARMLGPDAFGQYAFIMALVPLLALPASGGVIRFLTREIAHCVSAEAWARYRGLLRFSFAWVAGYSLFIIALVYLIIAVLEDKTAGSKWQLLPLATVLVPLTGLIAVLSGALKGLGAVRFAEIPAQLVRPAGFLLFLVAATLYGYLTPAFAIGGNLGIAALAGIAAFVLLQRRAPTSDAGAAAEYATREWSSALLPITLIALVATFNAQVSVVLLGVLGSNEAVAALSIAKSGSNLVAMSLIIVNATIGPQIVNYWREQDQHRLQQLSRRSARLATLVAAPIALVFVAIGAPLITLLYGAVYAESAYLPLIILALGQVVSVAFGSVGFLLVMSGHEHETLRGQAIALVINVLLCSLLIPAFGAIGAALGATGGLLVWNVVLAFRVRALLGIRPTAL